MTPAADRRHEEELDGLYRLPLDRFVAARNELAARAGDRAPGIRALPKPSVLAWALNQLYWSRKEIFDRLAAAAARLRAAQAQALLGQSSALRGADAEHRLALREALHATAAILEEGGGHAPGPDAVRDLTGALEALPWKEPAGRLSRPPRAAGFDALAGLRVASPPPPRTPESRAQRTPAKEVQRALVTAGPAERTAEPSRHPTTHPGRTSRHSSERRSALEQARSAVGAARRAEAAAEAHARELDARVEATRTRERELRDALAGAERARADAEREYHAAAEALDAARAAARAATRRLDEIQRD